MKPSTLTAGSSGGGALSSPRPDPRDIEPTTGQIFNVMRFSTHDGPGIRTTVFLKGCPLSCWWCHNPENWQHVPSEVYIADRCIGCGVCIDACPNRALDRTPQGITVDPIRCTHCGRCVDACPSEARERTGWPVTVPELLSTIERDIPFYEQSKGGVTFSGGEPLCQAEFLMAMLKACGRLEIHRAVDTSGYAASDVLLRVARFTDLFLFDLKALDPVTHRANTGVDNACILANLRQLSGSGADIVIRIPLIPGVNDDAQRLSEIGEFIAALPRKHPVDLLPYHAAAAGKYKKLGIGLRGANVTPASAERIAEIAHHLSDFGLTVRVGG
ncbi:MAG TPA: glycyl-radical enzyme activating protein [Desulfobacterales bacterium]|nr:glycyl-radical enzyme activating protein [Desulfobacterales bacterium]